MNIIVLSLSQTATKLQEVGTGASVALEIASYWSAALHLILAILGTFILKRFSTAFTVGCFLGVTVVVSQQNLLLFAAFYHYQHGNPMFNLIFADLALALQPTTNRIVAMERINLGEYVSRYIMSLTNFNV